MANLPLRFWGDPVLTTPAKTVTDIDGSVARLVKGMLKTMHSVNGLGIAAPQVGVQRRIFTYQMGKRTKPVTFINPTIVETDGEIEMEEGCLSIPGLYFDVIRPERVYMTGFDLDGNEISIEADDREARCLQHELDHLNGKLMLEVLTDEQRKEALRELRSRAATPIG